jgi:hypothetical protein
MGPGTELDGQTLVIPMRFQRRSGRERIVAPDGSGFVPTSNPQPDGLLACHDHLRCSSGGRRCRKRASSATS